MKEVISLADDVNMVVLSQKEVEILQYTANGLTSIEIGQKIVQSARNVDNIKAKIIKKTEAKNILEVIVALYKKGIIV